MKRADAEFALAKLSSEARAVWDDGDLSETSPNIIAELIDAGLVENKPDWSKRADAVHGATGPRDSVEVFLDHLDQENFAGALEDFEGWSLDDVLDRYEFADADAAAAIIREASAAIRASYDAAVTALAGLPRDEPAAEAA